MTSPLTPRNSWRLQPGKELASPTAKSVIQRLPSLTDHCASAATYAGKTLSDGFDSLLEQPAVKVLVVQCRKLVSSFAFEVVAMLCTLLNTGVLAYNHHNMTKDSYAVLDVINQVRAVSHTARLESLSQPTSTALGRGHLTQDTQPEVFGGLSVPAVPSFHPRKHKLRCPKVLESRCGAASASNAIRCCVEARVS